MTNSKRTKAKAIDLSPKEDWVDTLYFVGWSIFGGIVASGASWLLINSFTIHP